MYVIGEEAVHLTAFCGAFMRCAKKYYQFESEFTREDVSVQINQVPGDMMSNLVNQLKEQNALDKKRRPSGSGRSRATEPGHVNAGMPGNIIEVLVKEGDIVKAGQAVLVTEAMKMETEVHANVAGTVKGVYVTKGDRVTPGETLIDIV